MKKKKSYFKYDKKTATYTIRGISINEMHELQCLLLESTTVAVKKFEDEFYTIKLHRNESRLEGLRGARRKIIPSCYDIK